MTLGRGRVDPGKGKCLSEDEAPASKTRQTDGHVEVIIKYSSYMQQPMNRELYMAPGWSELLPKEMNWSQCKGCLLWVIGCNTIRLSSSAAQILGSCRGLWCLQLSWPSPLATSHLFINQSDHSGERSSTRSETQNRTGVGTAGSKSKDPIPSPWILPPCRTLHRDPRKGGCSLFSVEPGQLRGFQ